MELTAPAGSIETLEGETTPVGKSQIPSCVSRDIRHFHHLLTGVIPLILLCTMPSALRAREKDTIQYGAGVVVNLPYPEAQVLQVVQEVVQNGIIRGTKEYNADEYVKGATESQSTKAFPEWTEGGKVFYKIRLKALDPRNFKDSNDTGTLAVRYVVQVQDEKHTVLRIDARFVEDFRRAVHLSNGSVESAEYKDIHDRLDAMELMKAEASEAEKNKLASSTSTARNDASRTVGASPTEARNPVPDSKAPGVTQPLASTPSSTAQPSLEDQIHDLRRQVQRLVKSPGAALKAAPFHTAATLKSLPTGTEVLIVISTPYWLGVETHDGEHGWILRDELELVP